jgi:IclR family acetate operon transcriptional repressor
LHVTATGRALLSQMDPEDRAAVLRRANFERYTPTTLMSVAAVE